MPEGTSASSSAESMEEKPCSSTAASADVANDVMEEAKKLIGTGNRHVVMGDYASAVSVFQDACSMLAAVYGDTAYECGEAFFRCGSSLLELARMDNGVLGNALEDAPDGSDEEEQPQNSSADNADDDDDDDDDEDDDDDDDNNKEGEKNGEEEEVGNLQLAWEMLELAKIIYQKQDNKDDQLMAAQALLKLGEVGAESGNYSQALEDFQTCLALQLKYLPPHSRLLAETHYNVATTLCYVGQYNQAIQHYNSSIKVIETRLAMLQEVIDAAEGTDGAADEKVEVGELKQLLPDIREKVEDAKESQRTARAASQAIEQTLGGASTSTAFLCENGGPSSSSSSAFAAASQSPIKASEGASSSKAAADISHLVRKKRKPEEDSPVEDTDAKQAKREATVNGSGDSNASNGTGVQGEKTKESDKSASVKSSA